MAFIKLLIIFTITEWLTRILCTGAYIFATAEVPKSMLFIYIFSVLSGLGVSYWVHTRSRRKAAS